MTRERLFLEYHFHFLKPIFKNTRNEEKIVQYNSVQLDA